MNIELEDHLKETVEQVQPSARAQGKAIFKESVKTDTGKLKVSIHSMSRVTSAS